MALFDFEKSLCGYLNMTFIEIIKNLSTLAIAFN